MGGTCISTVGPQGNGIPAFFETRLRVSFKTRACADQFKALAASN